MLEAIGAGSARPIGTQDWADVWLESEEFAQTKRTIELLKSESLAVEHEVVDHLQAECTRMSFLLPFLKLIHVSTPQTQLVSGLNSKSSPFDNRNHYGVTQIMVLLDC